MKAIILNSGIGKRMGSLTQEIPKCLIRISSEDSILSRQLKLLIENKISKMIITTGPFKEKLENTVLKHFPNISAEFIHNPQYSTTNYIYSLYLIPRKLLDDDILLLHGDMVFEGQILRKIIISKHKNSVLVENSNLLPKKDFKGRLADGYIKEIGINVFGSGCFPLMPLYKFSKESFFIWLDEIDKFIIKGNSNVYAEDAFNCISNEIKLNPFFYDQEELCMEIDNEKDLEFVINSLNQRD